MKIYNVINFSLIATWKKDCKRWNLLAVAMALISSHLLAAITLIVVLGVTSLSLFIWMAAKQWTDKTGVSVAVIFILLTAVQAVLSFFWWRVTQRRRRKSQAQLELIAVNEKMNWTKKCSALLHEFPKLSKILMKHDRKHIFYVSDLDVYILL